jgi:DNA-directed RNA polymerase specialized sigma24 family protein
LSLDAARRARLGDRKVIKELLTHLRHKYGLSRPDTEDVLQSTYARASAAGGWPEAGVVLTPWLKSLSYFAFLDFLRQRVSSLGELTGDVDVVVEPNAEAEHAKVVVDIARELAAASTEHAETLERLLARAEPECVAEVIQLVARISAEAERKRVYRYRKAILSNVAIALAAAVAILLLVIHLLRPEPDRVAEGPYEHHANDPLEELPKPLTPRVLRDLAAAACRDEEYVQCLEYLDRARALDADGESKDVSAAKDRRTAEAAVGARR